jgi:hypothetical protein
MFTSRRDVFLHRRHSHGVAFSMTLPPPSRPPRSRSTSRSSRTARIVGRPGLFLEDAESGSWMNLGQRSRYGESRRNHRRVLLGISMRFRSNLEIGGEGCSFPGYMWRQLSKPSRGAIWARLGLFFRDESEPVRWHRCVICKLV